MRDIQASNLRHLDQRLAELDRYLLPRPPYGWVRSLRMAIGLSGFELGTRLGVSQPRISQIEHGEISGSLRLGTLDRVAAAMRCQLRYALIPKEPLEHLAREQAILDEYGWRPGPSQMAPQIPRG
jgi:predicted DNA-binding mobile mystery protein A